METYKLNEVEDMFIGKRGTLEREQYEFELKMDIMSDMIKKARKERNLTQEELGELVGVQKAQISKLERNAKNATVGTILKVFSALKAKVNFKIVFQNSEINVT